MIETKPVIIFYPLYQKSTVLYFHCHTNQSMIIGLAKSYFLRSNHFMMIFDQLSSSCATKQRNATKRKQGKGPLKKCKATLLDGRWPIRGKISASHGEKQHLRGALTKQGSKGVMRWPNEVFFMGKECFAKYSDVKYHKMKIENIFKCNLCCFVERMNVI